jgi:hypothetical protein
MERIKIAGVHTITVTQAAVTAEFISTLNQGSGITLVNSPVFGFSPGSGFSAATEQHGDLSLGFGDFNSQYPGDIHGGFSSAHRTTVGLHISSYHCFGQGAAAREPAGTAIGAGQNFLDPVDPGIFFHFELVSGNGEAIGEKGAQDPHGQDGYGYIEHVLFLKLVRQIP